MKRIIAGAFFLFFIGLTGSAQALDYAGRFGVGGSYGRAYPSSPGDFRAHTNDGEIWSADLKYGLTHNLMLVGSYGNITVENKDTHHDLLLRPVILSARYYAFNKSPVEPYLTVGAGYSHNNNQLPTGDQKFDKFAAQAGLGVEFFITPLASIGAEGLYHHIIATADQSPYRLVTVAGTVNFYFGSSESTKEAREEAKRAKEDADQARQKEAASAASATNSQQNADAARQEADRQAQLAKSAQQQLSAADQAKADADRKTQEMQAQMLAAQAEVDNIKQMIAKKEIKPIEFATGSDKLLAGSYPSLDRVRNVIAKYPTLKMRVEGHTDNVGSEAANLKLSQRRADAVKNYLVTNANVQGSQLDAVGFGETKPIASNNSAEGRAQNRRVEFLFVQ